MGLRQGGGISDNLKFVLNNSGFLFYQRLIFDLSFYLLVTLVLLSIFFGIIVDTFGDLRDAISSRDWDKKNVCFTCGILKSEVEQQGQSFQKH